MKIIEVEDLHKSYPHPEDKKKTFKAVNGISFSIKDGEIYGILGPNGAGKTTTLEMLEGLIDIDKGRASIDGLDVASDPFKVKKIIGVQLQSNEYFDSLSLKELLILFGKLYKKNIQSNLLLNEVNLLDKIHSKPEELSGGQKQRFSIACALVNEPKVLFLDEPTTGLDPQAKRNLWTLIKKLNQSGMTIILTTHNMEEAEKLCDKIAIMDKGELIVEDSPLNLIGSYDNQTKNGNLENVFLALTGHELRD